MSHWLLRSAFLILLVAFPQSFATSPSHSKLQLDRLCQQLLLELTTDDLLRLKAANAWLLSIVELLEDELFSEQLQISLAAEGLFVPTDSTETLHCSICRGASKTVRAYLIEVHPSLRDVELQETIKRLPLDKQKFLFHAYLILPDFFSNGWPLIIDPTIRQFFVSHYTASELEQVPKIFVGSPQQLAVLLAPLEAIYGLQPHSLSKRYLMTRDLDPSEF